jgi:hypothetical protein
MVIPQKVIIKWFRKVTPPYTIVNLLFTVTTQNIDMEGNFDTRTLLFMRRWAAHQIDPFLKVNFPTKSVNLSRIRSNILVVLQEL